MVKALEIIGIKAGAIFLIIGFLTVFVVIGAKLTASFLAIPIIFMVAGALLIAYGKRSIYHDRVVSTSEPKDATIEPEGVTIERKNLFCRYCGGETVSGEYCT